jgi:preprotein translocase subunit SecG
VSSLLTIIHVIVCVFLVLTILLQSGKSGGMGAAFGGGNAATVFGGSGASTFLRKLTASAASCFMATSMILAFLASHNSADSLEKFGESQQKLADEKEKQRDKALEDAKKGSAAGSGSAVIAPPMGGSAATMMSPGTITPDLEQPDGSAAPAAGSAAPAAGSAAATPIPSAPSGSAAPKSTPPAATPAAGSAAPKATTPAPAPTPAK